MRRCIFILQDVWNAFFFIAFDVFVHLLKIARVRLGHTRSMLVISVSMFKNIYGDFRTGFGHMWDVLGA